METFHVGGIWVSPAPLDAETLSEIGAQFSPSDESFCFWVDSKDPRRLEMSWDEDASSLEDAARRCPGLTARTGSTHNHGVGAEPWEWWRVGCVRGLRAQGRQAGFTGRPDVFACFGSLASASSHGPGHHLDLPPPVKKGHAGPAGDVAVADAPRHRPASCRRPHRGRRWLAFNSSTEAADGLIDSTFSSPGQLR